MIYYVTHCVHWSVHSHSHTWKTGMRLPATSDTVYMYMRRLIVLRSIVSYYSCLQHFALTVYVQTGRCLAVIAVSAASEPVDAPNLVRGSFAAVRGKARRKENQIMLRGRKQQVYAPDIDQPGSKMALHEVKLCLLGVSGGGGGLVGVRLAAVAE